MSPLINPDHLSPTGVRLAPPQARLVPMLAAALVGQGYSAAEAVRLAERAWARQEAQPATSARMADRAEQHAADAAKLRAESIQSKRLASDSRMRESR